MVSMLQLLACLTIYMEAMQGCCERHVTMTGTVYLIQQSFALGLHQVSLKRTDLCAHV